MMEDGRKEVLGYKYITDLSKTMKMIDVMTS
jgi:hypothetical protein